MTADAMRRFLRSMGLKDAAKGVPQPVTDQNPVAKMLNWKLGRGTLDARPGENHPMFMAFYDDRIKEELGRPEHLQDIELIEALTLARRDHQTFANAARPPRATRAPSVGGNQMDAQALQGLGAVIP